MEHGGSARRLAGGLRGRSRWFALLIAAALTAGIAGCSSVSQKFTESMSQLPAVGLPADAPERPNDPLAYPAVHDIPPSRNSVTLTSIEQQQMQDQLLDARDQQQNSVGIAKQKRPKSPLRPQAQSKPIVPVSSSQSIY
jgi:hypothetical protein